MVVKLVFNKKSLPENCPEGLYFDMNSLSLLEIVVHSTNPFGETKIAIATSANPTEPMIPTGKGPSSVLG